ncbi:beta-propeller fold lactonase family protein, partial [Oceanibaculum pacificum]|uniref:beta-propeller fold lactonase family protein n=1 Tax=Oceanibaculum pacificum TaxID=580166 RepID=UPI000A7A9CBD
MNVKPVVEGRSTTLIVTSAEDFADGNAATYELDASDGAGLTLKEALYWAQDGYTIVFASDVTQITLDNPLEISKQVTIDGGGTVSITGKGVRVPVGVADDKGGAVLQNIILKDISVVGDEIIDNNGVLTLRNVTIENAIVDVTADNATGLGVANFHNGTLYVEGLMISGTAVSTEGASSAAYVMRNQGVIHVAEGGLTLIDNTSQSDQSAANTFFNLSFATINVYGEDLIQFTGNHANEIPDNAIFNAQPFAASDYTPPSGGADAGGVTVDFTEGDAAVLIAEEATIVDEDSADLAALTVTLDSVDDGSSLSIDEDALAQVNPAIAAAYDPATGILTLTAADGAPVADFEAALRLVAYANAGDDPQNRSISIVATDMEGGDSEPEIVTVAVAGVNDAPTLEADGSTGQTVGAGLTSGGVALFDNSVIDTVEAGQKISEILLKATGLADGASEILTVDGTDVALTDGNSAGPTSNGLVIEVALSHGEATVSILASSPVEVQTMADILDGIVYRNEASAATGSRDFSLTGIKDDGGTDDGGVDSSPLSDITTSIEIKAAPVISLGGGTPSYGGMIKNGQDVPSDSLTQINNLIVSDDGKSVYVGSFYGVAQFDRDTGSGQLTFKQMLTDGENGHDSILNSTGLSLSPDGLSLYVAANSDGGLNLFDRDAATGDLTFKSVILDDNVPSLQSVRTVIVSPDGAHVYAASGYDGNITSFERDPATGELTYIGSIPDILGTSASESLAFSPDGLTLYSVSFHEDAIAIFTRDADTGALTHAGSIKHGDEVNSVTVEGMDGSTAVVVSPDGEHVYVASNNSSTIAVFDRGGDGSLSFSTAIYNNGPDGNIGLMFPKNLTISPDGDFLYVVSNGSSALTIFARDAATGNLTYLDHITDSPATDGLGGVGAVAISPDGRSVYTGGYTDQAIVTFSSGVSFTEKGGAVTLVSDVSISDNDSVTLDQVTLTLSATPDDSAESLFVDGDLPAGIVADYESGTLTLSVAGGASLADFEQALLLVKYDNTSANPTTTARTVTVVATDGDGTESAPSTISIVVTAVNDAPVIAGFGGSDTADSRAVTISAASAGIFVDAGTQASYSDADTLSLDGAEMEIKLTAGKQTGDDLSFDGTVISIEGDTSPYDLVYDDGHHAVTIGQIVGGGSTFSITFNDHATAEAVDAVVQNLRFTATLAGERKIGITMTDSDGAMSEQAVVTLTVTNPPT